MATPLFPLEPCSLPSLPAVDFEFASICEVLPAPPPIFDQPDIEIPLDFPPPKIVIPPVCLQCPILQASATVSLVFGSIAQAAVAVTPLTSAGSCDSQPVCTYLFDFDLRIPTPIVPCPTITASATATTLLSTSSAMVTVAVTQTGEPGNCNYLFDFDFQLPISITSVRQIQNITNQYGNVLLYGTAQLAQNMCDEVVGISINNFVFESPDFSGGAVTPPATANNPFKHRGKSGFKVLLVYFYILGAWVIMDVEKQKKRVYTNLRIKSDKLWIEGNAIDIAAECCADDVWTNLVEVGTC